MRLFIAIEIPDDLKKKLCSLKTNIPGARWVQAEHIHLTLSFLGEVNESALEQLNSELARIQMAEFELCFSGTGCFPGRQRARVLWVGLEPNPSLDELATKVRAAVLSCGIPLEERPFSPHITLSRLKMAATRELDAFLDYSPKGSLHSFRVEKFILFQSRLTSQGAVHTPLRSFPLTAV